MRNKRIYTGTNFDYDVVYKVLVHNSKYPQIVEKCLSPTCSKKLKKSSPKKSPQKRPKRLNYNEKNCINVKDDEDISSSESEQFDDPNEDKTFELKNEITDDSDYTDDEIIIKKSPLKKKSTRIKSPPKKKPKLTMTIVNEKKREDDYAFCKIELSPPKYPLKDSVIREILRLGGELPKLPLPKRKYRNLYDIPEPIAFFSSIKWPKDVRYQHYDFELYGLEFSEYDIVQRNEYAFLRCKPTSYLFAEGNVMLCTILDGDHLDNFDVYIIDDDYKNGGEGPFLLSEFLKGCTVDKGLELSQK